MAKAPKVNPLVARHDDMVGSILGWFDKADHATHVAGATWYPAALTLSMQFADTYGVTLDVAIAVISALSPRSKWAINVANAAAALAGKDKPKMAIGRDWDLARAIILAADPALLTGPKRLSFDANIHGDDQPVTVDTHALRVAGLITDDDQRPFGNVGGYEAVAKAYQTAAGLRGVSPMVMQAITWCAIRGGAF